MSKQSTLRLIAVAAATLLAASAQSASLVVNGSFESNTAGTTKFNPSNAVFNALMSGVTAYGTREGIDIQTFNSGYGQAPQEGAWKVSPANQAGGQSEEFSMTLAGPLTPGASYDLSFAIERLASGQFNGGTVEVGVSTTATSFGTQIASATAPANGWLLASGSFLAPTAASYLTVRVITTFGWVGLDNFVLSASPIPEPASAALLGAGLAAIVFWRARRRS